MEKKIRSKEVGLISLVTVVSQLISGNLSTKNISDDLSKVQLEISKLRLERSEHFVNKSDFHVLGAKVDKASEQLQALKIQTTSLKNFLKSNLHYNYSYLPQPERVAFKLMNVKKTRYEN